MGRLIPAWLLALALAGCATAPTLSSKGLRDARSTAAELESATAPRRVALLVGVPTYEDPSFAPLRFAPADAETLGRLLRAPTGGGFDRVEILVAPERTTRSEVLRQLRLAAEGLAPEDVLVVYFSGHGTLGTADKAGRLYLLGSDAQAADLPATALDLSDLRTWFGRQVPQRKALIVDACFNGRGKSTVDPDLRPRLEQVLASVETTGLDSLGSGEAHLYATTLGRAAYEDESLGHGVYTHFLIQAMSWARTAADLDGDGVVTAYEAHDYARGRVQEHTEGRQVPEASLRVVGRNDVVLVGEPSARSERDRALVFDYSSGDSRFSGASLWLNGRAKGAFPGTLAVPAGEHHVEVRAADGERLLEGYATFESSKSVGLGDLQVLVRKERFLQSIRLGGLAGPAHPWGAIWGDGLLAIEGFGAFRKHEGIARGLMIGGTLGGGLSPRRGGGLAVDAPRGVLWAAAEVGYAGAVRRVRIRAAWQLRLTGVPSVVVPGLTGDPRPEEQGWMLFTMGPSLQAGVALNRRWTAVLAGSWQTAILRTDPEGPPGLHGFATVTAGMELAL